MSLVRFVRSPADRALARKLRVALRNYNFQRFGRDPDGEEDPRLDGRTLCAFHRRVLIGTIDVHWGGDADMPPDKFDLHRCEDITRGAAPETIVVLDEPMIHPEHREEPIDVELKEGAARFALRKRARFVFSASDPSEVPVHQALGFRVCGPPGANRRSSNLVPIVLDLADLTHLESVRSPLAGLAAKVAEEGFLGDERAPAAAPANATYDDATDVELDQNAVWRHIFQLRRDARRSGAAFLSHIEKSELSGLLYGSHLMTYDKGDKLIRQGDQGRELFLILEGEVAAMKDRKILAFLTAGDVVGEIGFLLETQRTSDVVAFSSVRALKISASHLDDLLEKDATLAAHMSLGIAKALCRKLARANAG